MTAGSEAEAVPGEPRRDYRVEPARRIGGEIAVPGDKSISHRALMLGAIAEGETVIRNFLESEDCVATRRALEALGAIFRDGPQRTLRVDGAGPSGLRRFPGMLDLGNSGTGIRLLTGLLAAQAFDSRLTGDASLCQRPMERVAAPLRAMGARIRTHDGKAPIEIEGGAALTGIDHELGVASAQVKSALLLAALYASGTTTVRSPAPSRDHTERMLRCMGAQLESDDDGLAVSLTGPQALQGTAVDVPGDLSSAAFFLVAGCLAAADGMLICNVGVNPTRTGLLTILSAMGARIEIRNPRMAGAEPVADLYVEQAPLKGIDVPPELVPLAIDEFPILFVAAAGARGPTIVRGAEELRHKESDRLGAMARGLAALGGRVEERAAGLIIEGGRLAGGRVDSLGDHRVAMAFAVASLISDGPIRVGDTAAVSTSFPGFPEAASRAGLSVEEVPGG